MFEMWERSFINNDGMYRGTASTYRSVDEQISLCAPTLALARRLLHSLAEDSEIFPRIFSMCGEVHRLRGAEPKAED